MATTAAAAAVARNAQRRVPWLLERGVLDLVSGADGEVHGKTRGMTLLAAEPILASSTMASMSMALAWRSTSGSVWRTAPTAASFSSVSIASPFDLDVFDFRSQMPFSSLDRVQLVA